MILVFLEYGVKMNFQKNIEYVAHKNTVLQLSEDIKFKYWNWT